MGRRLQNVAIGSLIAFLIVALNLTYWSVIERDRLRTRADNPRRIEAERATVRGRILDRNSVVLARSEPSGRMLSGAVAQRRVYPQESAFSVTGYYSLVYGSSGAEFAFEDALRGTARSDAWSAALDELLNRPLRGDDLRLTVDVQLQVVAAQAFGEHCGAAVLLEVPSGAVRLLYSTPIYDPNTLDADWERLRNDPSAPLLNRALQGTYQLGGALQLIIYAAMLANPAGQPHTFASAALPLSLDALTVRCAVEPSAPIKGLEDALAYGCPRLFAEFALEYPAQVQEKIAAFGLLSVSPLDGYPVAAERRVTPLNELTAPTDRLRAGVGQGDLTVTPLQMALVASGIANYGNLVTPYIADALRAPDSETWQPVSRLSIERAAMTREAAERMRAALRESVLSGSAQAALTSDLPPEATLYAHASLAFSGNTQHGWLIGFVALPDGRALALATVVESVEDVHIAARIGGRLLASAAQRALQD